MKTTAFLLFLLFAVVCHAENGQLGRTADGRAYRIDSEGNRVIDYIADLEMNVDSLNRQVQGLESELQEKIQIIERMRDGQICESGIQERDLQENNTSYADTNYVWNGSPANCDEEIKTAQAQLKAQCERSDTLRRNEITALQAKLAAQQGESSMLQAQIQSSRQQLSAAEEDKLRKELVSTNTEAERLSREIQAASDRVAQMQDELSSRNSEYGLLQAQLASAEKRTAALRREMDAGSKSPSVERASLSPAAVMKNQNAPREMKQDRQYAMDSLRGSVSNKLNHVQGLVSARDKVYRESQGKGSGAVAFRPSAARTADGRDLPALQS